MAKRRMMSLDIIDTDKFLEMPLSTQNLYFHLLARGDDDGFINSPKRILKLIGCNEDDLKILFSKNYVIPFDSGICVISDWKIHNYIRGDRYHETFYKKELSLLSEDSNGAYLLAGIPNDKKMDTEVRLGKVRLGNKILCPQGTNFIPPILEEIKAYCFERNNDIIAQSFIDYYESVGWMIGKKKMKNWKAAIRTWEKNNKQNNQLKGGLF